jgi:sugar phosphate isomerase/epimerase
VTTPGIPNDYTLSTTCFGARLKTIQDQIFAAVGMGFRRIELGLSEAPPEMDGLEDSQRETGVTIQSLIAGCRDKMNGSMASSHLASLVPEARERAFHSLRRHVRLAKTWGADTVVVRGSKIEDQALKIEAAELEKRHAEDPGEPVIQEEIVAFVSKVARCSQAQIAQFCRSLHEVWQEAPEMTFAIEPGRELDDVITFESLSWVLDDLDAQGVRYWHDVGRIHLREKLGLPAQGAWLDAYGSKMAGIHLQDAGGNEAEMPLGLGDVDFQLVAEYLPAEAERVLEIDPRHGRAELLASVQFLVDHGF